VVSLFVCSFVLLLERLGVGIANDTGRKVRNV
jgi:hypothetical protein